MREFFKNEMTERKNIVEGGFFSEGMFWNYETDQIKLKSWVDKNKYF